jgi:hypothetical protein
MSRYSDDEQAAYDDGYDDGVEDQRERAEHEADQSVALEAIQARYEYLRKSGQWQRETTGDLYVRGFEDAMKVLGLLPMVGP